MATLSCCSYWAWGRRSRRRAWKKRRLCLGTGTIAINDRNCCSSNLFWCHPFTFPWHIFASSNPFQSLHLLPSHNMPVWQNRKQAHTDQIACQCWWQVLVKKPCLLIPNLELFLPDMVQLYSQMCGIPQAGCVSNFVFVYFFPQNKYDEK